MTCPSPAPITPRHPALAPSFEPFYYQTAADAAVQTEMDAGVSRTLVVLPTGTGKTFCMVLLVPRFGLPVLFLAHKEELLDQLHRHLVRALPEVLVGIEQAARSLRGDEEIVLASIPTLVKSPQRLKQLRAQPFTAVIVDEVHHATAPSWTQVLRSLHCFDQGGPPLIGFTATPKRGDNVGLHTIFQSIAYQRSLRDMIVEGWLTPLKAFTVTTKTSLDGIRIHQSVTGERDFAIGELSHRVNTPSRNALVVESYARFGESRQALVFATSIVHAKALVGTFRNAGYQADYVADDLRPKHERSVRIARFKRGGLQILVNVAILVEGFDFPGLSCVILARPTNSALLYAQIIGRVTRRCAGKEDSIVIDLVDACRKHQIQNVGALFGLDPRVTFNGEPVIKTVEQIENELARHPELHLGDCVAAQNLLRRAAQLTLDAAPVPVVLDLPPDVKQFARLAWYRLSDEKYLIHGGDDLYYHIIRDTLGNWDVFRMPALDRVDRAPFRNLQAAFGAAETDLRAKNISQYRLNLQDATWRQKPPTDGQQAYLRRIGSWHPGLTRGDASSIIEQRKLHRLEHPPEALPATPNQEKLLRRIRRWRQGMSKAEASTELTSYYAEPADSGQRAALERRGLWRDGMTRGEAVEALRTANATGGTTGGGQRTSTVNRPAWPPQTPSPRGPSDGKPARP